MSTSAHELPDRSDRSDRSVRSPTRKRLRPAGGYRTTASFQTATLIYDATYWFCEKFLDPRSRTVDQMVQAARSGRQNIAEGSRFAATSSQTELRLLNTARSSLEELLLDYEDFLFHRHLPHWAPESAEARAVRAVGQQLGRDRPDQPDRSDPSDPQAQRRALHARYARWLDHADPAVRANTIICLIHQANYLLDQQLTALEQAFIEEGGYSEQLATARLARRSRRNPSDPSDPSDPIPQCPQCGMPMALRTAKTGPHAGRQFWGCTGYPDCKGVVEL
jgi:restriction system protein